MKHIAAFTIIFLTLMVGTGFELSGGGLGLIGGVRNSFYQNVIVESRYLLVLEGLRTTLVISVFSGLLGTLLGVLTCVMRLSRYAVFSLTSRAFISLMRGIPLLVLLMLLFYVILGPLRINPVLVSIIAFSLNFAAYASEIFRSAILGVDRGQYEAGLAGGFTKAQTFVHIIIPQAVPRVIPVYKGEFINMIKMTSVVGYIAVMDLTKASDIIRSRTFDAFFPLVMVAVLYYMINWLLTLSLDYLAYKSDPETRRRKGGKDDKSHKSFQEIWRA